jgi:phytoene dehydrogenase-like protein
MIAPDVREHVIFKDAFTPRTIVKYTGHAGGAVYGSPRKQAGGETPIDGLFLCGTDQGLLGIVGALHSGISIANTRLMEKARLLTQNRASPSLPTTLGGES